MEEGSRDADRTSILGTPRRYQKLSVIFSIDWPTLRLVYTSTGSGKGKCRLEDYYLNCNTSNPSTDNVQPYVIDFAGTDSIFFSTDYSNYPDLQLYPAIAAAVVAIYNIPGQPDLVLTPAVLAAIFRQCQNTSLLCPPGYIYSWSDPAILTLNPDPTVQAALRAAGNITVVVRADNSGTTEIFKNALNIFDPTGFGVQVYPNSGSSGSQSATWYNVAVTKGNTNNGVVAHVLATPGSISYTSLDLARSTVGIKYAGGGKSVLAADGILRATAESVSFALVENGFAFGNNGDNATRLTATISGAKGSEAWPMVGYSYFAVRKDTLRTGATCANRQATLQWLQWFYSSDAAQNAITAQGFGNLPIELRNLLLKDVRAQFLCQGSPVANQVVEVVATAQSGIPVNVYATQGILAPMQLYGESYDEVTGKTLTTVSLFSYQQTLEAKPNDLFVLDREALALAGFYRQVTVLPVAAAPWGVIYNLCDSTLSTSCSPTLGSVNVVLDAQLVFDILDGVVNMWNDPRIVNNTVNAAYLPAQPIIVIGYQSGVNDLVKLQSIFMTRLGKQSSFSAVQHWVNDSNSAALLVGALQNSLTVAPINVNQDNSISRVASMMDASLQVVVTGNQTALNACLPPALPSSQSSVINVQTSYLLAASNQLGCWPLAEAYFIVAPSVFNQSECLAGLPQAAIVFVNHTLQFDSTPLGLQGYAQLGQQQAVSALSSITCYGRDISNPTVDPSYLPLPLVYFTWVLAILIIVACVFMAAWVWDHRMHGVVNASSPIFMIQMTVGCIVQVSSIIPMTFQENIVASTAQLNLACMAYPWLFFVGFALVYAPLLVKSYRIYRLFNNRKLIRFKITNLDLIKIELVGFVPVILLMVLWTELSPMYWTRVVTGTDSATGLVYATAGTCTSDNFLSALLPIVIYLGAWIVAGVVFTFLTRNAPTDFSEGRYISMNIVMLAEALALGVPIIILSSQSPLASFLVKMLIVVLTVTLTLGIFFMPKVAIVHGLWDSEESSSNPNLAVKRGSFVQQPGSGGSYDQQRPGGPSPKGSPKGSPHSSWVSSRLPSPVGSSAFATTSEPPSSTANTAPSTIAPKKGSGGFMESAFPMFGYVKEHSKESLDSSSDSMPKIVDEKTGKPYNPFGR